MPRLWQSYVALSVVAVGVFGATVHTLTGDILYVLIGLASAVAIVLGLRVNRPTDRMPWVLLAAGQACWVMGDVLFTWLKLSDRAPFPSIADAAYLLSYPLLGLGIVLLIRSQQRSRDLAGLVDGLIVTAGFGLLTWAFIAGPIISDLGSEGTGDVVALSYLAADLVLVALLMRLVTGQGTWSPSFVLLIGGSGCLLAADAIFAAAPTSGAAVVESNLLWLSAYALWGSAALHPDMTRLTQPVPVGPTPFTSRRLALLGGVVLLPTALLVLRTVLDLDIGLVALIVGAAILSLLVMARMACDIDEITATAHQRDVLREDLVHRATRDDVTGVANRPFILEQITSALQRGLWDGSPSAVLDVRLHGGSELAHELGLACHDHALRDVALRIEAVVAAEDRVARLGSDEFAILVDRLGPDANLNTLAGHLLDAIEEPLQLEGRSWRFSADIGIAMSHGDCTDASSLLHEARLAAASARSNPLVRIEFFDPTLRLEQIHRLEVEEGLRAALASDGLEVHYQPVVALPGEVLDGYEALVRWDRPGLGPQQPDTFIPIAEQSDLICDIDRWVLREATLRLVEWTAQDPIRFTDLTVSVNISGRHLASSTVVDDVTESLTRSGLEPYRLTLEITETVLVDVPLAARQMAALRQLGVCISIDDFGTGFTSIAQLGSVPADVVKIDRSLVTSTEPGAAELLALIVEAGHASGMLVVAEGVESPGQLDIIRGLSVDFAQGFLFARPSDAEGVVRPRSHLRLVQPGDGPQPPTT